MTRAQLYFSRLLSREEKTTRKHFEWRFIDTLLQILRGTKTKLCNDSVLEIAGLKFVFLINQDLIEAVRQEATKMYQNSSWKLRQCCWLWSNDRTLKRSSFDMADHLNISDIFLFWFKSRFFTQSYNICKFNECYGSVQTVSFVFAKKSHNG